jgi:hypothetical protein
MLPLSLIDPNSPVPIPALLRFPTAFTFALSVISIAPPKSALAPEPIPEPVLSEKATTSALFLITIFPLSVISLSSPLPIEAPPCHL